MRLASLVALLSLAVTTTFAAPSPPYNNRPPPLGQFESLHQHLRYFRQTSWRGVPEPPAWERGRFKMGLMGVPRFGSEEDTIRWESCARFYGMPASKVIGGWPYRSPAWQEQMEICIFYALGMIPDEGVEARLPLDELARRYNLVDDETYMFPEDEFERFEPGTKPVEFSGQDIIKQVAPYLRFKGSQGNTKPGAPLRVPPR